MSWLAVTFTTQEINSLIPEVDSVQRLILVYHFVFHLSFYKITKTRDPDHEEEDQSLLPSLQRLNRKSKEN